MNDKIKPGSWVRRKYINEEIQVQGVGPFNVVLLNEVDAFSVTPVRGFWDRFELLEAAE